MGTDHAARRSRGRPRRVSAGGGFPAIFHSLRQARHAGGVLAMYRALRSRNACKSCALGMGGRKGGMVNERGHFPEVCKKAVQAMAADMRGAIRPGLFDEFDFDRLSRLSPRELESLGRLVQPLCAGPGDRSYRPIGWDDAIARAAAAMRAAPPPESFFYFSGRSSNEAGFLLQVVARVFGTTNVNNCSFFCHQASGVGLKSSLGSGTATVTLDDLDRCDLFVLIGGNPASNHPRLMRTLMDLRRRGGRVVVVNPMREVGLVRFRVPSDVRSLLFGTPIADLYLQPHIGGDAALLTGLCRAILDMGAHDPGFIARCTEGWDAFERSLREADWETIVLRSGIERAAIERLAHEYARAGHAVFAWTMGITHHAHGVGNVRMIANAALMRGMVGREGAGLLPIRGHSNVQGMGSIGAVPNLSPRILDALDASLGTSLPRSPGLDTLSCVERAAQGRIRFAMCLGGNLFGSCPDAAFASGALARIDTTIFLSTALNTGHIRGRGRESIILPVLARDEDPQPTTQESMFSFVRMSAGGARRHHGPRSETDVIASIARAVLGGFPVDWSRLSSHIELRRLIADVVPGYGPAAEMDRGAGEFHIEGRRLDRPAFPPPSGRARFHAVPLPPALETGPGGLRLMTVRSEGQFNTVVYEDEDLYRGQERRDVILMNRADIARLGLRVDEPVTVRSRCGEMRGVLVREGDIRAGNAAMYYPEANVLVPALADPESRTPAFKSVVVRVERAGSLPVLAP